MTIAVLGTPPVRHHKVPCHRSSPHHPPPLCQPTLVAPLCQTTSVGHFTCDWASELLLAVMLHSMSWSTYRDSSEFHSTWTLDPPCTHAPAAVLVVFDVLVNNGGGGGSSSCSSSSSSSNSSSSSCSSGIRACVSLVWVGGFGFCFVILLYYGLVWGIRHYRY